MQYCGTEELLAIHLEDGENLHQCIVTACQGINLDSAVILSGLGMAKSVTFGWYTGTEYLRRTYGDVMELVGLSGDVSFRQDGMYPHLHGAFSTTDHGMIGGHVMEVIAFRNMEIFLKPVYSIHFNRRQMDAFEALIPEHRA